MVLTDAVIRQACVAVCILVVANACGARAEQAPADSGAGTARTLPVVGTTWCYQSGGPGVTAMTLKEVSSGVARYDIQMGPATAHADEQIDTYTMLNNATRQGQRRVLAFPLDQDKDWSDEFEETITARLGREGRWRYTYQAKSESHVLGVKTITVGAGQFDTIVVERNTSWVKRAPGSSGPTLRTMHCNDASCEVAGFSKDVIWYAPSIGRGVLRAYTQGGNATAIWNWSPENILRNADSIVVELVGYGASAAACGDARPPRFTHEPSASWFGFPFLDNDTWEYLMQGDVANE